MLEIRRFWSAYVDALARHLDRMASTGQKPAVAPKTSAKAEEVSLNWNKWIRQIHRWLSIAFTVGVIVNLVAVVMHRYTGWVGLLAGLPLALLLVTGLYLFVLPYAVKWRIGRHTG